MSKNNCSRNRAKTKNETSKNRTLEGANEHTEEKRAMNSGEETREAQGVRRRKGRREGRGRSRECGQDPSVLLHTFRVTVTVTVHKCSRNRQRFRNVCDFFSHISFFACTKPAMFTDIMHVVP